MWPNGVSLRVCIHFVCQYRYCKLSRLRQLQSLLFNLANSPSPSSASLCAASEVVVPQLSDSCVVNRDHPSSCLASRPSYARLLRGGWRCLVYDRVLQPRRSAAAPRAKLQCYSSWSV
ncbi:hypothetical protein M758_1G266900 [Ceratodon purpureus]|nr:hypothetical protein M758_1G266900 [Ceratodon purpureus]